MFALGCAIAGSLLLNASVLLQANDARRAPPALLLRPGLLWHLMQRAGWLLGTGLTVVSALLQLAALKTLSVAVVQSVTAGGVLLLPLHAWVSRGEVPGRARMLALACILVGVTVGAVTVPVGEGRVAFSAGMVGGACGLSSAAAFLLARGRRSAGGLAFVAGVGFAASTVLQKVFALQTLPVPRAMALGLLILTGAIGFLAEMSALQLGSPAQVAPIVLGVSSVVPGLAARALFAEVWPRPALTLGGLLVALVASVFTSREAHTPPSIRRPAEPRL